MTPPDATPAPLGFKILVGAAVCYLLVRLVQGVVWLAGIIA